MKTKLKIEIEVKDIEVENGYHTFQYNVTTDGKSGGWEEYQSDYEGWEDQEWLEELENGQALQEILERVAEL